MGHAGDVADGVVGVELRVAPLGLGVLRVGDRGETLGTLLSERRVLSTCRFGQAVGWVIFEGLGRVGVGVVEEDALLREVADPGDVAGGVVVVAQVLHGAQVGVVVRALGVDPDEAEGGWVVLVVGGRAVAVLDAEALAAGVVVDVRDDVGGGLGAADVDGDALEEAAGAEGLGGEALVGCLLGQDAAEGVVGPGGREGLGLEEYGGGGVDRGGIGLGGEVDPVGDGGVVLGEAALGREEVAPKVVLEAREDAGAVVDAVELAAVVGVAGVVAEALAAAAGPRRRCRA